MEFTDESALIFVRALDRLAIAIVLMSPDGQVHFANGTAKRMLSRGDGLHLSGNRMVASSVGLTVRIETLLQRMSLRTNSVPTPELCIAVPRQHTPYPYVLHLVLLAEFWPKGSDAAAMVVIIDAAPGDGAGSEALGSLFGLTAAELTVARLLRDGRTVQEIAVELQVSLNTVRTHLKKAFQKLGVHRQAELVRLLTLTSILRVWPSDSDTAG